MAKKTAKGGKKKGGKKRSEPPAGPGVSRADTPFFLDADSLACPMPSDGSRE
jgi:hypothetical protein